MAIEQLPDGCWRVDVEPVQERRFRKTLKTKGEDLRLEATCRFSFFHRKIGYPDLAVDLR